MTATTRSLQATSMTCQWSQDRDVTFTYTATDNDTGVSEAGDHHHYYVTGSSGFAPGPCKRRGFGDRRKTRY
ncbi:hypothetical protein O9993_05540 [Vibrio lentus]|nr:hypothetical protein [Vibrio lentus]